jgi:predicted phosphohydrolase
VGAAEHFEECLSLFESLPALKALVPGNHDIWVQAQDARGDSLSVYEHHLPEACARHRFHYLDRGPLLFPDVKLGLVGTMNWYDYSWSVDKLRELLPDWEWRLRAKVFSRGRHNDARFVRWPLDDVRFTERTVSRFEEYLQSALAQVEQAIVIAHHPPFRGLGTPHVEPPSADALLWEAFTGNLRMEAVLNNHAAAIPFAFCGHTHFARENALGSIRGFNVGGDYHFKRLLLLDWPDGSPQAHVFGRSA